MITVNLPFPDKRLNPNRLGHWSETSKVRKQAKSDAWAIALGQGAKKFEALKVEAHFTITPPNRRRRDQDNIIASLKPYIDGMALAIGVDDADWDMKFKFVPPKSPGSVHVAIIPRKNNHPD